jgi:tRNA wybutosine-synthesizing protein 1
MINERNLELLKKQHYVVAGKHSAVQICRWTKHSLIGEGECYKYKFYGIPSWRCAEMSPSAVWCDNMCLHCWRAIEATQGNKMLSKGIDSPKVIIEECLKGRKKLLTGFGGHARLDKKRYEESNDPSHFAISLIGEPTLYPKIGDLVEEIRKRGKTSFIVTNGLHPEVLKKLDKKNQLPTQLYVSLNSSNEKEYNQWQRSKLKNAWKKYNETLELLNKFTKKGRRTVFRMTLVKGDKQNIDDKHIKEFAGLIKKAGVMYVEVKSYMSLGYARARMGYETMLSLKEIEEFAKKLAKASGYLVLDKHVPSRIVLLGKDKEAKKRMKISKNEI